MAKKLDVIIFGATGFTGKWTVFEACKVLKDYKWGVAGRSHDKVKAVLQEMSTKSKIDLSDHPISVADVDNESSLEEMTSQCRLLVNCCGPYRLFGEPVVRACLKTGTHHLDVSGESQFMELMQLKYHKKAENKGIYVISACGFDSIPSEIGLLYMEKNFDGVINSVETYLKSFMLKKMSYNGPKANTGTWNSIVHALGNLDEMRDIRARLFPQKLPRFEPKLKTRSLISSMEGVNGVLVPFPGPDLAVMMRSQRYFYETEKKRPIQVMSYLNFKTKLEAIGVILFGGFFMFMSKFAFGRKLLLKYPKVFSFGFFSPDGPAEEYMQNTGFALFLKGQGWPATEKVLEPTDKFPTPPNSSITVKVTGVNPGYGATCVALLSSAVTVLKETDKLPGNGGVLPPGAAFAKTNIIEELEKHEHGLKFEVVEKQH